ncbi:MAG TPA: hypothetical protein VGC41_04880, partial [Kofleriaceae bacterium]
RSIQSVYCSPMSKMTRRTWCKLLVGGSAAAMVAACSSSDSTPADAAGPDAPAGCTVSDAVVMIADNHPHAPHALVVPSADILAGVDKTYDIQGMANHNHQITITAAEFAMLQAGGTIMDTSTIGLCHTHVVTTSCG